MPFSRRHHGVGRFRAALRIAPLLLSGLCFAATPPAATMAQSVPVDRPTQAAPYAAFITEASRRFGVPEHWIRAVMRVESRGDARALSSAGAMGLMQIMPDTWVDLRARHRLGTDPYDPRDNILAGAAYLREMHDRFGSPGFLAAYNAGPGRYQEHLDGRRLPAETRAYVAALAPLVGSGTVGDVVLVAATDPQSWRRSPLFIGQSNRTSSADPVQQDGRTEDAPTASTVRDVSAIVPLSNGLFVARSGAGDRP